MRQKPKVSSRKHWRVTKPNQTKASDRPPDLQSKTRTSGFARQISDWNARHPILAILLVSLVAVVINGYPVIFCGRSYVSPGCMGAMVYCWRPTLPGMQPVRQVSEHGSDTAATMIGGIPFGFIESRSLLEQGTLPLWNRFGHAGSPLLGQTVSMLGDPLQLIVIFGHGSAWAWDIKFLTAKFLFCAGFGLLILRFLASEPMALIYAALAAYCGTFFFINNHPAFFVFSYAPWILLSAHAMLDLQSGRHVRWGLVWLLANFACFNAGFVEAAVVLIGGLNLAAVACALTGCHTVAASARVLGRVMVGTLLFLGLTAPVWLSFLGALEGSYSAHSEIGVFQLPLSYLPGVFDDIFFPRVAKAVAPGTSLLVLTGCILAGLKWRQLKGEPFFWVNSGAILAWGGCIFGWVPASVLAAIPLLNRVGHTFSDFSYLLAIHLTLQSAYGFKCLARAENFRRAALDFVWVALIFGGMLLISRFGTGPRSIPGSYLFCVGAGAIGAPLLFLFLKTRNRRIPVAGWAAIIVLGLAAQFRFGLYHLGNDKLLMLMAPRVVLNAPSKAVERIQADKSGPFRAVGLLWSFYGDYSAVYGIEDIRSCAPLSNGQYIELVKNFPGMDLSDNWIIEVRDAALAQPLLNLLNVKYLLARPGLELPDRPGFRITDRSDFDVVENLEVWPRAFFSNRIVSISSNEEFTKLLLANGQQPFIALTPEAIEQQPGVRALENTKAATVQPAANYQLLPNSTAFDVHATSAGMVCLTEGQAGDFTARANGEPKAVLTVNRAFKGVYLDQPGAYHLEFIYRPRHWRLACSLFWIAAGGAILLAVLSIIRARSAGAVK